MTLMDLLALGMWPLTAAGVWFGRKSLHLDEKDVRRTVLRAMASAAFLVATGVFATIIFVFPHHSAISTAMEYSIIAALGLLLLWSAWRMDLTRLKLIVCTALGFICLGWGLYYLVGDFLLWRVSTEGHVLDKRFEIREGCRRCRPEYFIGMSGGRYKATEQVFEAVAVGQRIRAEVGRISGRIMSVQTLPF